MGELKTVEQDFVTTDTALTSALNILVEEQKHFGKKNSAYIWRQRHNEGKLSHKKVAEILEAAGYKKVVEEKWLLVRSNSIAPGAAMKKTRGPYAKKQTKLRKGKERPEHETK